MTPRTKARPKARTEKARVMWSHRMYSDGTIQCHPERDGYTQREQVAVLPLPLPQARKLRDFANLSEEERVEACARALHLGINFKWGDIREAERNQYRQQARSILSLIGL